MFYMRPNIFRQKSKYIRSPFYIKYGANKGRMYTKGRNGGNAAEVVSVPFGVKMTANRLFSSNNFLYFDIIRNKYFYFDNTLRATARENICRAMFYG